MIVMVVVMVFMVVFIVIIVVVMAGWQMLGARGTGGPRKVKVFSERKDPQHTLFCRET